MRSGQLAHLTGVSTDTLRHYERLGQFSETDRGARIRLATSSPETTDAVQTIREVSGCASNRNGQYGPIFRVYNRRQL